MDDNNTKKIIKLLEQILEQLQYINASMPEAVDDAAILNKLDDIETAIGNG